MRTTLLLLLLAAAALAAAAASGASAAPRATLMHSSYVAKDVAAQTSSNWAGYAVTPLDTTTGFSSVSGSWTQPTATCTRGSATYSAFWVGLGGFSDGSQALEQTGTEADCSANGRPSYSVWYELVPAPPVSVNIPVQPGDSISATVSVTGQTVSIQLSNTTRGATFTKQVTVAQTDVGSAEWIAEAPSACSNFGGCRPLPLTNFGTATFTSAAATDNGHTGTVSDPAWSPTALTLQGVSGRGLRRRFAYAPASPVANAVPAALSADGSSFAVAWQQAQPQGRARA